MVKGFTNLLILNFAFGNLADNGEGLGDGHLSWFWFPRRGPRSAMGLDFIPSPPSAPRRLPLPVSPALSALLL